MIAPIKPPPRPPRSVYATKLDEFGEIAFADDRAIGMRGRWDAFFARRIGPNFSQRIVLEIGCADGEFVTRIAEKFPRPAFIGLDWKCKATYDAAARVARSGLANLAFIRGRAQDIRRTFAPRELDELWIFHPEPCDRPAELRNRLISPPFLNDAAGVITSRLCLKTDHAGYFAHVLGACGAAQLKLAICSTDFWRDEVAQRTTQERAFANETTTYERRFISKRKPIFYLELAPLLPLS